MKIVLISPKGPLYRSKGGIFKKSLRYQPLTLTTLASLVPASLNAEIVLIDEGIEDVPANIDADIIGMTVITGTAKRAYELAKKFREQGRIVVLGGPHVTLLPEEAAQHADSIVTGYAEDTWPELLNDFVSGHLKPIYRQAPDLSLKDRPFPARELFDGKNFLTQAVFEATRSCAHDCEFCVAPTAWGRNQYQRPVDWVIEDIKQVGQKKIIFIDLNLISDKRYAKQLFQQLIPLNVQWYGLSTVLIAHDEELIELIARSGCKGLLLGLETVSQDNLKDANKRFNASVKYKDVIGELHRLGVAIQGCFVFGLDHDTPDVFDTTVEFAIETGIDLPRFAVLTPFPGTPLYQRLSKENRILNRNWELYDGQHVVFQPRNMSIEELAQGHERAWKKVYRWSSIGKRLWRAKNFSTLALSANFGYRFYAHNLHRFYNCDWQIDPLFPNPFSQYIVDSEAARKPDDDENRIICG
ncbi:MAG: B12-binding domain-containing radical SAM protein [Gammaproteobacteria bacterium]|nr:B12-binding domain-containing radical SAM protein [Gammaproteobacteria bacterium]MBL6999057.1 B12-binding domain-containing radical SAM protein [Gammaproteobacteria bacterium]